MRDRSMRKICVLGAAIFVALLSVGCREQVPSATTEIRGEPINPVRGSSTPVQLAMTQPAATSRAPSPQPSPPVGERENSAAGFSSVGFDKLSAYKFDPDEELLNPQTNRPAAQVRSADA